LVETKKNIGRNQEKHWKKPRKTLVETKKNIGRNQEKHWKETAGI
jgi:hypothetical protein